MFSSYDHSRHQQAIAHQTRMQRKVATERLLRRKQVTLREDVAVRTPQGDGQSRRGFAPLSAGTLP